MPRGRPARGSWPSGGSTGGSGSSTSRPAHSSRRSTGTAHPSGASRGRERCSSRGTAMGGWECGISLIVCGLPPVRKYIDGDGAASIGLAPRRRSHMSRFAALLVAAALAVLAPARAFAAYHIAHISEIMSGISGNPSVQYVEIRMDAPFQNVVGNTRLTVFDCTGTTATVLLTIPDPSMGGTVPNQGGGRHWIMGTSTLAAATTPSVTPDFVMMQGIPTTCGMVCWGGPADPMTFTSKDPSMWSASVPDNYIDCVAYGPYTGPQRTACTGFPLVSDNPGDGTFSLTRNTNTCYDFSLACPTPTNNGPPSGAEVTGTFGPCTAPTTTTTVATTTTTTVTT